MEHNAEQVCSISLLRFFVPVCGYVESYEVRDIYGSRGERSILTIAIASSPRDSESEPGKGGSSEKQQHWPQLAILLDSHCRYLYRMQDSEGALEPLHRQLYDELPNSASHVCALQNRVQ